MFTTEKKLVTSPSSPILLSACKPAPLRKFRTTLSLLPSDLKARQLDESGPSSPSSPLDSPVFDLSASANETLLRKPAQLQKQKTHMGTHKLGWRTKTAVVQPISLSDLSRNKNSLTDKSSWSNSTASSERSSARSSFSDRSWTSSLSNPSTQSNSMIDPESLLRGLHAVPSLKDLPSDSYVPPEDILVDFNDQDNLVIGEGGQGKIFKAFLYGEEVAIKMSDSSRVLEEFALVHKLRHRNIIRPIAYTVARTTVQEDPADQSLSGRTESVITYMAVYEYCRNGDLGTYLQNNPAKVNNVPWITDVLDSILEALAHIHAKNHIHTDVKPDNILVAADGTVRLGDFGMCQKISDRMIAQGTPSYLPPEMVAAWHTSREPKRYTGASDIFSFGVLMTNVLTNKYPYRRITARLRRGISMSKDEMDAVFCPPSKRYHEIERINQKFAVLVKLCLRVDPTERANAEFLRQILKMDAL